MQLSAEPLDFDESEVDRFNIEVERVIEKFPPIPKGLRWHSLESILVEGLIYKGKLGTNTGYYLEIKYSSYHLDGLNFLLVIGRIWYWTLMALGLGGVGRVGHMGGGFRII